MTDVDISTREFQGVQIPNPGTFTLDPAHIRVGFVARHLMVSKVRGSFTEVSGTITIADDPAQSAVDVTIQTASVHTGVEQRDGHLRSADFFESETYPTITFRSTGLLTKGGNEFTLVGDLTVKQVTQSVELEVEFEGVAKSPWGKEVLGFSATTEVDREVFGLTWNQALEAGGVVVSKRIKIEIEGEATRD